MPKISFPILQYDLAVIEFMREVRTGSEQLDPLLGQVERIPVSHGGTTRQVSEPQILDTQMQQSSVETNNPTRLVSRNRCRRFRCFPVGILRAV